MKPLLPTLPSEPLLLARPLALVIGLAVIALAGILWGPAGTLAAAIGTALSLGNVFLLARLGTRAVSQAEGGDAAVATAAASRLQLALGGKTIILLALVALIAHRGPIVDTATTTAFALGLLVTVFALVAGGLLAPFGDRQNPTRTTI